MSSNKWLLLIQFGILGVLVILDAVFQEDIQQSGARLDYNIQFMRNKHWDNLFILIGQASKVLITIAFIPLYLDHSRLYGQLYTFVVITAIYMNNILKMLYSNPRPYWTDDDVDAVTCDSGFGNPSGHAMFTAPGIMFLAYIWCLNNLNPTANILKFSVCIFMVLLVGFDRLYLGVHSYAQVILGWTYGNLILTACIFFKTHINHTLFLQGRKDKNMLFITAASIILITIPIIIHYLCDPYWLSSWSARYLSVTFT
jgi:membrane-associated phospholipid phosphatase